MPTERRLRQQVVRKGDEDACREIVLASNLLLKKQIEARTAELQKSESRYRCITEGITDYLYTVRIENGRAVETTQNPACLTVTGYTAEEFASHPNLWIEMVVPEDRDLVTSRVQQVLAGRNIPPIEHRIIHKNGQIRWVSDTTVLLKDESGKLVSYTGVIKDITEQRQAARLLAEKQILTESERKFRMITESAQEAIIMMGADKCISLWNASAEHMFGYTADEVLGREMHPLLTPPETIAAFEKGFSRFRETGTGPVIGKRLELTALRRGGDSFPVEVTISALQINGQWNAIGIFRDITERRLSEKKIQSSLAEKEVLMREIHHRVKNNMQMMTALLELQAAYVKDGRVQGYFKDCQQRIQSMAMIHEQLYHNENIAQIDFVAYLHSLVDKLQGQFSELCHRVNIQIKTQTCTLPVDIAIPCGLVVNELVSNVFKHAFPNRRAGKLRIALRYSGHETLILTVADDGVGFPAGLDIHDSQSFGLQVIALMVEEQLGGNLSIESNVDHGTRITCKIEVQK